MHAIVSDEMRYFREWLERCAHFLLMDGFQLGRMQLDDHLLVPIKKRKIKMKIKFPGSFVNATHKNVQLQLPPSR